MPRLTNTLKIKVIRLQREGKRIWDILRILSQQDNFSINRRHLATFLKCYSETGEMNPPPPKKKANPKCTPEVMAFIDRKMEENDETTATDLSRMISRHIEAWRHQDCPVHWYHEG